MSPGWLSSVFISLFIYDSFLQLWEWKISSERDNFLLLLGSSSLEAETLGEGLQFVPTLRMSNTKILTATETKRRAGIWFMYIITC